jgi:hypothetical protein
MLTINAITDMHKPISDITNKVLSFDSIMFNI